MSAPGASSMPAELEAHRREQPIGEARPRRASESARTAPPSSTGAGTAVVDGGLQRPAAFAGVRDAAGEVVERRDRSASASAVRSSSHERDDAAAPPDLGDRRRGRSRTGSVRDGAAAWSRRRPSCVRAPALACARMLKPSAYAAISPYSMPLWTIFTKWPAPAGPQCR